MAEQSPREINREDVRLMARRGAQLVEVLPAEEYEKVHLAGALNIPLKMFSRSTADRLKWDRPVIVYCADLQCDLSARAAWRLASLGFTQVYRYAAGKADWLANGLPAEGSQARSPGCGDLADMDVPTCKKVERVGEVRGRVGKAGWDTCVVVNDHQVVLGLLRANDLSNANPTWTAEEAMERDPRAYRLDTPPQKARLYMERSGRDSVLVTTSDGKLFGLLKREAVQGAS